MKSFQNVTESWWVLIFFFAVQSLGRSIVDKLYTDYRAGMWRLACKLVHDEYTADDVVQAAFVKLLHKADLLEGLSETKRKAYIAVTVKNTAYDVMRTRRIDVDLESVQLEDAAGSAGDIVARIVDRDALQNCLNDLAQVDRDLLALRYGLDLDYNDISATLNMESGTARVRVHRALAALKKAMHMTTGEHYAE